MGAQPSTIAYKKNALRADHGEPLVLFHGSKEKFSSFSHRPGGDQGFHFGSEAQARMRAGSSGWLYSVVLNVSRIKNAKDTGSWGKDTFRRARAAGYDCIRYLNRYEGVTTERINELSANGTLSKLDSLSDKDFLRVVPEADYSYAVFDPGLIHVLSVESLSPEASVASTMLP
ncbi:hypothetical protein SAMN05428964_105124 [Thalassospira xiamenensis]|nr:hypothetical protein SAMN05428964_105124 [Thalassospira xiamenensis]